MTVREFIQFDQRYQEYIADQSISRIKRLRLGFRLSESKPKDSELIDNILMNKIRLANAVLSPNANVRIPFWMGQNTFNSFIAKIGILCN